MTVSALIAHPPGWAFTPLPIRPLRPDRVRVRVALAGLCRTDIQAMTGLRAVAPGRILGHEAAGWVDHIPQALKAAAAAQGLAEGDRVAFFPFLPCGTCPACAAREPLGYCHRPSVLGLDEDGAFSPHVDLPLQVIGRAPASLPWESLAYAEPVAAALSVLGVPEVHTAARVAVLGQGRIADLTARVIESWVPGRPVLRLWNGPDSVELEEGTLDVVVETLPLEAALKQAVQALRPGGILVLKSRPSRPVAWPHQEMVLRRIRTVGVAYGDFAGGLEAMASGRLKVDDLMGDRLSWSSAGVEGALAQEALGESGGKLFFNIAALPMDRPTPDRIA